MVNTMGAEKRLVSLWQETMALLKERASQEVFETWFKELSIGNINDNQVALTVPNKFFRDWIRDHYQNLLEEALGTAMGQTAVRVSYVLPETESREKLTSAPEPDRPVQATALKGKRTAHLDGRYTFATFVAASNNQLARAASLKVAESPGISYNPLLIYGGVGLGKTHLMHAIGNQATQEEFFHTFNSLYEARKQIVLSSDRYPKDIADMEERLRSRLDWGLVADIQPYPLEARIAILRDKSEREGIVLPDEVSMFVATHVKSNIRELEGSLIRLGAYAALTGQAITMELAQNVLKELVNDARRVVTLDAIQEVVAARFHIKVSEMKSKRRTKALVYPRQMAMYLCREITQQSYPEIARHFGGKDHTTIMHACRQIEKAKENNPGLQGTLEELKRQIAG